MDIKWEKKCVVSLKGLGDDIDRESIRDAIKDYDDNSGDREKAVYVDYSRGQTYGALRFPAPSPNIEELVESLLYLLVFQMRLNQNYSLERLLYGSVMSHLKTRMEIQKNIRVASVEKITLRLNLSSSWHSSG